MSELRDYEQWHRSYDDPGSGLSWRLAQVRDHVRAALDRRPGPVRVLSLCSGDGRDVLGVLAERADRDRVSAVLVELEPAIAEAARAAARASGLGGVEVRTADAAEPDAYADALPADLVLLVGIFGNISDDDLWATIAATRQLCAPGATLIWSRGRDRSDLNDEIRTRFQAAGFRELGYAFRDQRGRPALGALRYEGPAVPLRAGQRLFTFVR